MHDPVSWHFGRPLDAWVTERCGVWVPWFFLGPLTPWTLDVWGSGYLGISGLECLATMGKVAGGLEDVEQPLSRCLSQ